MLPQQNKGGNYSPAYSISMTAENALILNSALILFLPPAERNISLTASIATETARSKVKNRIRRKGTHSNILATIKLIFTKITLLLNRHLWEQGFGPYTEVAFVEGLFCTQTVHLGPGLYAFL